jgi:hypothetical protein
VVPGTSWAVALWYSKDWPTRSSRAVESTGAVVVLGDDDRVVEVAEAVGGSDGSVVDGFDGFGPSDGFGCSDGLGGSSGRRT